VCTAMRLVFDKITTERILRNPCSTRSYKKKKKTEATCQGLRARVFFETSFDSKQQKLVSALSRTKCLFRLFRFYTKTESFNVSIEPKQTEDQPKQFDREHILVFFSENLGFF
jgi:hypothetical protein